MDIIKQRDLILEEIRLTHRDDEDVTVPLKSIEFNTLQERFILHPDKRLEMSDHAKTQLLGRLNIPASYINRCSVNLYGTNVNYWIYQYKTKEIMLRFRNGGVRAIFSNRYSTDLDDDKLFPVVFDALWGAAENPVTDLEISNFRAADELSVLFVKLLREQATYNNLTCHAGVNIVNSEVGVSSVWIRPVVFTSDGLSLLDHSAEGTTNIKHIGDLNTNRIKDAILQATKTAAVGIHQLFQSTTQYIKPQEVIENHFIPQGLSQRMAQMIIDDLQSVEEINKYELAKHILLAIRDLPVLQRQQITGKVGRYLNLFKDTNKRLTSINQRIDALDL